MELKTQKKSTLLSKSLSEAEEVVKRLRASRRVLIASHEHPDGDAVGSALALFHALRLQGKEVTVYLPDEPPDQLSFLPASQEITTQKPAVDNFDTVVILDCTRVYRAHLAEEVAKHPNSIVIDHHFNNDKQGRVNLVLTEAAATAQILTELFKAFNIPLTRDVATCLLTGIFTDTGSFMHDSVTPDILELASELMSKGARLSHIAHETYQKKELPGLRIWGQALSRVMVNQKTGAAVSIITQEDLTETKATLEDLSGVVNLLNTLPQAKFALLLTEYEPGKIKGSLRSEPHKNVDVSAIARRLGGGGHKLASGFEIDGHLVQKDGGIWQIDPV